MSKYFFKIMVLLRKVMELTGDDDLPEKAGDH